MEEHDPLDAIVERLTRTTALPAALARRVVADVVDALAEPVDEVVRRRHRELQARGMANAEIFDRIVEELRVRPVAAPPLTVRQVRRTIYG
ncbi:MAG: hypothetical protein KDB04_14330 [Acidimicrobiales bacterium]|nr:hypothetical protein [Acidimicrobiales bacterium]HRW37228.1 hypothetical protein [Aquihabitans sp.]